MVYFIDVEIARSNCRKLSDNNDNCIVQENIKLEKVGDKPTVCDGLGCSEPQRELRVSRLTL